MLKELPLTSFQLDADHEQLRLRSFSEAEGVTYEITLPAATLQKVLARTHDAPEAA